VTAFPSLYRYALAQTCPTCKATPGATCDAPRKSAKARRIEGLRSELGLSLTAPEPITLLHKTRQQAGARHYRRDIGNAPWADEREAGKRYDTLGDTA
jgi:hypothetical protein